MNSGMWEYGYPAPGDARHCENALGEAYYGSERAK